MPRPVDFPDEGVGILFHGLQVGFLFFQGEDPRGDEKQILQGRRMDHVGQRLVAGVDFAQTGGQLMRSDTQGSADAALGIGADDQHGMAREGKGCAKVDRGSGFPDSALAADQADDPAFDRAPGGALRRGLKSG